MGSGSAKSLGERYGSYLVWRVVDVDVWGQDSKQIEGRKEEEGEIRRTSGRVLLTHMCH